MASVNRPMCPTAGARNSARREKFNMAGGPIGRPTDGTFV